MWAILSFAKNPLGQSDLESSVALEWNGVWFYASRYPSVKQQVEGISLEQAAPDMVSASEVWLFIDPQNLLNRLVPDFHFLHVDRR